MPSADPGRKSVADREDGPHKGEGAKTSELVRRGQEECGRAR